MFSKISFFFNNMFGSLRDAPNSHSLNKLICIVLTIVYSYTSIVYTTKDNLVMVLGVHAGLITALLVSHRYFSNKSNDAQPDDRDSQQPGK